MSSTEARDQATSAGPAEPGRRAGAGGQAGAPRRRRRRWLAVAVVVVIVVAGVAVAADEGAFGKGKPPSAGPANNGYATSTFTVQRESLTSQTQEDATLGDAGTYSVVVPQASSSSSGSSSGSSGSSSGTFTWLPQAGQTIRQGHRLYSVSGSPVVLLYGSVPAYRDLYEGLIGPDVTELNRDLVRLGYTTAAALGPRSGWDDYSAATAYAVEQFQTHFGMTVTGELSLGEAVIQPGSVLVTALGTTTSLGSPATAGTVVMTGTSTSPQVIIPLDAGSEGEVKAGDAVSVTLPDGSITPGKVTQVSKIATSSSSGSGSPGGSSTDSGGSSPGGSGTSGPATINVYVSLTHPKAAGNLNQAPVTVTITVSHVSNVLVVPVDALLAQPHGQYAVEVISGHSHRLVKVTPGLFDDAAGMVQVTGNLTPGQRVVVPGI